MQNKSGSKPNAADLKKQLEVFAGQEINLTEEQMIRFIFPQGNYSYADGNASWWRFFLPSLVCNESTLLDVGGLSSTGADGTKIVLVSDFVCFFNGYTYSEPINVVATCRTASPVFLTLTHTLVASGTDIQINVFTWDANGKPAPNVSFDWRCRAVANPIIFKKPVKKGV